jgi:uncharacterized protein (DUF58 family)
MSVPLTQPGAAPPAASPAGRLIDPVVLMGIRHLELRARVVVEGFWSGLHRSPCHGFSVEFTEYRAYSPGDDLRYLDWRVLARSDRYFVKRFEDETNLRCHLLVDQSRSMAYGSLPFPKADYAATLAASLAWFLHLQGDAVGLLTFHETVGDYLPPRHRPGHLRRLLFLLDRPAAGRGTDLTAPLQRAAELLRKRGLVIVLSDFLAPLERLDRALLELAAGGHEIVVFQILDPAETAFDFRTPAVFEDLESGRALQLDPVSARAEYQRRLAAHSEALREICRRLGISFTRLETRQPLELALLEFLRRRTERGRRPFRVARSGARGAVPVP